MKWHRIFGILYRYILVTKRSYYRMIDIFYWPVLDIVLWGITSYFIQSVAKDIPNIVLMLLSGVLFWLVVSRSQNDLSVSMLDDLWNKNLVNIFVSPLHFYEWVVALLLYSIIRTFVAVLVSATLAFFLYHFNVLIFGFKLVPIMALLFMSSWWLGLFINSFILRYGSKAGFLAWSAIMITSPFSAIYYPVAILPEWAQTVAAFIPMSHIFEAARQVINQGILDWHKLTVSFALSLLYMAVAFYIFRKSYKKLLDRGLAKIY